MNDEDIKHLGNELHLKLESNDRVFVRNSIDTEYEILGFASAIGGSRWVLVYENTKHQPEYVIVSELNWIKFPRVIRSNIYQVDIESIQTL